MSWLHRLLRRDGDLHRLVTLAELSELTGVKYITLYRAIREGRLKAVQSGSIWLCSVQAVERAQAEGKIRRE